MRHNLIPFFGVIMLLVANVHADTGPTGAPDEASELSPGQASKGLLGGRDTASFAIPASKGDYVELTLDQLGTSRIDASLYEPNGSFIRKYSEVSPGPYLLSFVADVEGAFRLDLNSLNGKPASYTLTLDLVIPAGAAKRSDAEGSPRSARLRSLELSPGSFETFWRDRAQSGSPIIEASGPNKYLVTFLWRGTPATKSVRLIWSLLRSMPAEFTKLGRSDLWYKTVELAAGTRFTYRVAPDVPPAAPPRGAVLAVAQRDPLNPRTWGDDPAGGRFSQSSIVELPGAEVPSAVIEKEGIRRGRVDHRQYASVILANERDLAVYTPAGYTPGCGPYDLLIILDGGAYLGRVPVPTILDNLVAERQIRPTVAVFVGNPSIESRNTELVPNESFPRFLADELLPWIRASYNVSNNPAQVVLAGSSLGGLAATYAAFRRPDTFGAVLSQSGAYWWAPDRNPLDPTRYDEQAEPAWLTRQLAVAPRKPLRFYLDAGKYETGEGGGILDSVRGLRTVLEAKGYPVSYQEFVGGHSYLNWRHTFEDGVLALMPAKRAAKPCASG